MAGRARGSARALLAALLAPALLALLVAPARGRGGRGHGDWDAAALLPPLPPREDAARVARFVTHVCDWGALATLSTDQAVRGWAFADVLSLSDGPPGAGSGVPYFYLSPLQQSVGNLQVSGRPPGRPFRGRNSARDGGRGRWGEEFARGPRPCLFSAAWPAGLRSALAVGRLAAGNFTHAPASGVNASPVPAWRTSHPWLVLGRGRACDSKSYGACPSFGVKNVPFSSKKLIHNIRE